MQQNHQQSHQSAGVGMSDIPDGYANVTEPSQQLFLVLEFMLPSLEHQLAGRKLQDDLKVVSARGGVCVGLCHRQ